MGYGGESWNKKLVRLEVVGWAATSATARKSPGPAETREAAKAKARGLRCMVLAGPDSADVRLLREKGVAPSNIVAVDMDASCAARASEVEPACVVRCMDAVEAARLHRGEIDLLVLDLCAQLNEASVDLFAKVAGIACTDGAAAVVAFSYGREMGSRGRQVSVAKGAWQDPTRVVAPRKTEHDARLARVSVFMGHAASSFAKRGLAWIGRESPLMATFYPAKNGARMVYFSGTVHRSSDRRYCGAVQARSHLETPSIIAARPATRNWIDGLAVNANDSSIAFPRYVDGGEAAVRAAALRYRSWGVSSADVADRLNLDKRVVAAWFAVDTMQRRAS